jgi:hypothetical protein
MRMHETMAKESGRENEGAHTHVCVYLHVSAGLCRFISPQHVKHNDIHARARAHTHTHTTLQLNKQQKFLSASFFGHV